VASEVKEEMKESCEMENSEVRFYDVRSSKGRLPFLNKVSCCDVYFSSLNVVIFYCVQENARYSFNLDVHTTGFYTNIYSFMSCTNNKKGPYFVTESLFR